MKTANIRPKVTQPFGSLAEALQFLGDNRAPNIDPQDLTSPEYDPTEAIPEYDPREEIPSQTPQEMVSQERAGRRQRAKDIINQGTDSLFGGGKGSAPAASKPEPAPKKQQPTLRVVRHKGDPVEAPPPESSAVPSASGLGGLDPKTLMLLAGLVGSGLGGGAGFLSGRDDDEEGKGGTRLRNSLLGMLLGGGLGVGGAYLYNRLQKKGAFNPDQLFRRY